MSADQIKDSGVRRDARSAKSVSSQLAEDSDDKVTIVLPTAAVDPYASGTPPTAAKIVLRRMGNGAASISWSGITGTAGTGAKLQYSDANSDAPIIPEAFRPSATQTAVVQISNNSVLASGMFSVTSEGYIKIATVADGAFTGSGTCAVTPGSFVYAL